MEYAEGAVVPVLFEHSLRKANEDAVVTVGQVLGIEPVRLRNPATDSELALALRVLEGCCLLCSDCTAAAHRYNAVKVRPLQRCIFCLASMAVSETGRCSSGVPLQLVGTFSSRR